jgi:hypothetical protein
MGIDPFRKALTPFWLTNRLMASQPCHMDFDDPFQRKFIEEFPDESFKRDPSVGGSISIDRPEVSDVQYETAGHQGCDEPKKMGDRY